MKTELLQEVQHKLVYAQLVDCEASIELFGCDCELCPCVPAAHYHNRPSCKNDVFFQHALVKKYLLNRLVSPEISWMQS